MGEYFSVDYGGPPFVMLGAPRILAFAGLAVLNVALSRLRTASESHKNSARWTLAAVLWIAEISWHIWNIAAGAWSVTYLLPLNVCSVLIWLSGLMLVLRSYPIYEFAYFLGIGAATQYLVTPDLGPYGFPHFRFIQTFISHGLLVTAPIYMTVVERFRPTWKSILRVFVGTNAYMVVMYRLNLVLGSNYLMLNAKPVTPSLLDLLPPWPYYIIGMELIGILTFILLYVPFMIGGRRAPHAASAA